MTPIALAETPDDLAYVHAHFATWPALARHLGEADWPGHRLPRATYQTADGTQWFARDWWRLHDDAGSVAAVRSLFERRLAAAALRLGHACDLADKWSAYLDGLYGACLREVTPEAIALKDFLVIRIDRAIGDPRPRDPAWGRALRADVDALDGITRSFAACDRIRFGRPTSRDRLIRDVRARFGEALACSG